MGVQPPLSHPFSASQVEALLDPGTGAILRCLCFVNDSTGWAVGSGGTIRRTVDGGETWVAQSSGTYAGLRGVDFVNDTTGWVVGDNGMILFTADGGATWSQQASGTGVVLKEVCFVDEQTGWAVGYANTILNTTDGGFIWWPQETDLWGNFKSTSFVDTQQGWAVGDAGIILHTATGGETPQVTPDSAPVTTSLLTSFPNPFNPALTVELRLPAAGEVILSVLDIGGRLVEELHRGGLVRGEHRFEWRPGTRAAGVYLLELRSGEEREVRKVCYLK